MVFFWLRIASNIRVPTESMLLVKKNATFSQCPIEVIQYSHMAFHSCKRFGLRYPTYSQLDLYLGLKLSNVKF